MLKFAHPRRGAAADAAADAATPVVVALRGSEAAAKLAVHMRLGVGLGVLNAARGVERGYHNFAKGDKGGDGTSGAALLRKQSTLRLDSSICYDVRALPPSAALATNEGGNGGGDGGSRDDAWASQDCLVSQVALAIQLYSHQLHPATP